MQRFIPKYKETISDMNEEYRNLLRAYKTGDTRVEYLETFEQALALNCNTSLWENRRYFVITAKYPIPAKGYTSRKKFKLYLMLYYYIMSDAGLLNREAELAYTGDFQTHAFGDER